MIPIIHGKESDTCFEEADKSIAGLARDSGTVVKPSHLMHGECLPSAGPVNWKLLSD